LESLLRRNAGFHVIFEIEILKSGSLAFWADDGSIIERGGLIVHQDRTAHRLQRNLIIVSAGERLRIASWQCYGDWLWGHHYAPQPASAVQLNHFSAFCRRSKAK
jgi:hypothetical protein